MHKRKIEQIIISGTLTVFIVILCCMIIFVMEDYRYNASFSAVLKKEFNCKGVNVKVLHAQVLECIVKAQELYKICEGTRDVIPEIIFQCEKVVNNRHCKPVYKKYVNQRKHRMFPEYTPEFLPCDFPELEKDQNKACEETLDENSIDSR